MKFFIFHKFKILHFVLFIFHFIFIDFLFSQDWKLLGLEGESISAIAVDPSNPSIIYAGSSSDFSSGRIGGIFKSVNYGVSWDTLVRGITARDLDIHPINNNIIYAISTLNVLTTPGILKSENGGISWFKSDSGITFSWEQGPSELVIDPQHPDTLYTGTGGPFGGPPYKSVNGGKYWFRIDPEEVLDPLEEGIVSIAIDPSNTEHLYFGTAGLGLMFETMDGGNSWDTVDLPKDNIIYDIEINSLLPNVIVVGFAQLGFFISNDYGETWKNNNEGLPNPSVNVVDIQLFPKEEKTEIYLRANWADGNGIYMMKEDSTWEKIGIENKHVSTIKIIGSKLFAGSNGLYVRELITSLSIPVKKRLNNFDLKLFPNPTNSELSINVNSTQLNNLTIELFDVLGRQKKVLTSEKAFNGQYLQKVNLNNFSSGIYIIRAKNDREVICKKFILMK